MNPTEVTKYKPVSCKDKTGSDKHKTGTEETRLEVTRTSRFPGGPSHGLKKESVRVRKGR